MLQFPLRAPLRDIKFLLLRPKYFERSRYMAWPSIPSLLASPGYKQPWCWLWRIQVRMDCAKSLSIDDNKYLCMFLSNKLCTKRVNSQRKVHSHGLGFCVIYEENTPVRYQMQLFLSYHYDDVIMGMIASQITSLTIVYSTVYSGADQSKHQSSASLAFVWGIHNVFIWWRHHVKLVVNSERHQSGLMKW